MAKNNDLGISQLPNGNWRYRFTRTVDGKRVNRKSSKDEAGNPLTTKRAALQAKAIAEMRFEASINQKPKHRMTFGEVYAEYSELGRSGKAYSTIKKQDSLWRNHLGEKFGARFIDDISVAEVNDYLSYLYYTEGRAYRYVNSMKYHSRTIKTALKIDFKYHYLRHTYGTRLAEMNTPTHILCNQMGHASGKVTERYYLAVSKTGIDILLDNLNAV